MLRKICTHLSAFTSSFAVYWYTSRFTPSSCTKLRNHNRLHYLRHQAPTCPVVPQSMQLRIHPQRWLGFIMAILEEICTIKNKGRAEYRLQVWLQSANEQLLKIAFSLEDDLLFHTCEDDLLFHTCDAVRNIAFQVVISSAAQSTFYWFARPCYLPSKKDDCTSQNRNDAMLQGCIACFCGITCAGTCKKMCIGSELGMTGMTAYNACMKEHIHSKPCKCSAWHTFDIMNQQATLLVNTLRC